MATALVQLDNGVDRICRGWSTLTGSAVTQLVITASQGCRTASADAKLLHDHLVSTMQRHHARPEATLCRDSFGPGADGCWASHHAGPVRRTLVWVVDANTSPPIVNLGPQRAHPWTTVLPIMPNGVPVSRLPLLAQTQIVRWYTPGQIAATVPNVLVNAGLGLDAFRVFISYRWDDCRAFAEQLFDGLSHEQFDVYLDRFRTSPGTNFAERIRAELADKACVVLLDSRDVGQSEWVRCEHAFARLYKLGLMAIDLPGGQRTFGRIGTRLDLRRAKPGTDFSQSSVLSPKTVARAIDFVRKHYFAEISRRFRHQRRLIRTSAGIVGVATTTRPDGLIETAAPHCYMIAASARPPRLENFRLACEAAAGSVPVSKAVVVGPLFAPTHQTREDVRWLAGATGSVAVDERRLLKAMRRLAAGQL